jgi:hypothetical protein
VLCLSYRTLNVVDRRSSVFEAFVPQKSFALAHSIISKRFLKHSVGFYSSFVEPEAKFDADSLLLKIRPFSWRKKSPDH